MDEALFGVRMGKQSNTKAMVALDLISKLVVVGAPGLYFIGWAYAEGLWTAFGVSDGSLGYSSIELMKLGVIGVINSFLSVVASKWIISTILLLFVAMLVLIMLRFWLPRGLMFGYAKILWIKRKVLSSQQLRLRRKVSVAKFIDNAFEKVALLTVGFAGFVVGGVILVLILVGPALALGKEDGASWLARLKDLEHDKQGFLMGVRMNSVSISIGCGGEMCVVYSGMAIEVIKKSEILRFEPCRQVRYGHAGRLYCAKLWGLENELGIQ